MRQKIARARQLALMGGSSLALPLRPARVAQAQAEMKARVANRERRFLAMARRLIFAQPASPYLRLLRWAGCEAGDLEAMLVADGLEGTLDQLREAGAYLSYEEFRGTRPIVRDGLVVETSPADFDNPLLMGRAIGLRTSGTSSAPRRVAFDWLGLAEEAAENLDARGSSAQRRPHGPLASDARRVLWAACAVDERQARPSSATLLLADRQRHRA